MGCNCSKSALVFDIRRFTVHDGPGIRTTVFFKGCTLHCEWCQNPESIDDRAEILFYEQKCIRCGACQKICPVIRADEHVTRKNCLRCGKCAEVCMTGARKFAGEMYTPEALFHEVMKDAAFYRDSGGVSVSGGEPLHQADFLKEFAALCKSEGLHLTVDTCGNVPWSSFEKILPYSDLFLYDLKVIDPSLHKMFTGADNHLILENIVRLADAEKQIVVRVPLIPAYTDTIENIEQIAAFIRSRLAGRIVRVDLLPFNSLAETKYLQSSIYDGGSFGRYPLEGVQTQNQVFLNQLKDIFVRCQIPVSLESI